MTLNEAILPYLEKKYPCVGLKENPPDHSCDNAILFTATWAVLCCKTSIDPGPAESALVNLVKACQIAPGSYLRYPGDTGGPTSHDDLTGICVASNLLGLPLSLGVLRYAEDHDWQWGTNWLGRLPDFVACVKASARVNLSFATQIAAVSGFLWNMFENKEETSGKCLLYLKSMVYDDYPLIKAVIMIWKIRMTLTYGNPRNLYSIYFGPIHPFTIFAPERF